MLIYNIETEQNIYLIQMLSFIYIYIFNGIIYYNYHNYVNEEHERLLHLILLKDIQLI